MKYFLLVVILVFLSCKKEEQNAKAEATKADSKKEVVDNKPAEVKGDEIEVKKIEPVKVELPKPQISLLDAVKAGNLDEVKSNLHHNPKLVKDVETDYKKHPVFVAILENQPKILKELLTVYSANCSSIRKGVPLVVAAIKKNLECVKILVDYKAEIDALDPRGTTAFFVACSRDQMEMLEFLLENGADINKVNKPESDPSTALDIALESKHWKIANYLKKKGAKQYKDL